jgi:hypothetical protein
MNEFAQMNHKKISGKDTDAEQKQNEQSRIRTRALHMSAYATEAP